MEKGLYNRLVEIMDLEKPEEEARKKLCGTYMFVNGNLELIYSFDTEENKIWVVDEKLGAKTFIRFKTLSVWLPETGIYQTKEGGTVFLSRTPLRQWYKSFNYSVYKILNLNGGKINKSVLNSISKEKRTNIFVDSKKGIWFRDIEVGHILNKEEFICTNKNYLQELKDWNRVCK